jgi:ATP-dependent DNA helicase RecG
MPEPARPSQSDPATAGLDSPVTVVRGVGPDRARLLERLGVHAVGDLLLLRPHRHEDRRGLASIRSLTAGITATVAGRIVAAGTKTFSHRAKSVFEFVLDDGTGRLHCRWWNLPFMERLFCVGDDVVVFGKVRSIRPRTMDHPETEKGEPGEDRSLHVGRIVPIYPLTEGLSQRVVRNLTAAALAQFAEQVADRGPVIVPAATADFRVTARIPVGVRPGAQADLPLLPPAWPSRRAAIEALHFPKELPDAELARQRLALDEFIDLQLAIQRRRQNLERKATALPCAGDNRLMKPFLAALGFTLTESQTAVLREIRTDLGGTVPMRRLLQGDVGSGKTIVAACAALMTLESGFHVALMAPTAILAEQLHTHFSRWFQPLGIPVGLWTASHKDSGDTLWNSAAPGVVVGTHALIHDGFAADRLGLVIIDEQHKFGVTQRERLVRKGRYPHLLVMTATPIPRTLGLTLYGDLDVSIILHPPGGRGRIRTHVRPPAALPRVWEFIQRELAAGRQAYIVYPRVNDSEHDDVKSVTREHPRIAAALAPYRVGRLHGQLPPPEKEQAMAAFRRGELQALVATSVIEVGVDVPNATVMLIEHAEQFGLAQLHQLRGRIGRGSHESHCILVAESATEAATDRLKIMAATNDGFELAEADLRLRGPGELVGQSQSGLPDLRFGDLAADRALVEFARELVRAHLAT